jgi:Flp pilus assembly protein TadD
LLHAEAGEGEKQKATKRRRTCEEAAHGCRAELRPDLGETKNNLGIVLSRKGRADEAIRAFEEALQASPELLQIRLNLAEAYGQRERYAEARDMYASLLTVDPNNIVIRNNYALALFKSGAKEKAAEEFRRVLQLKPDFKAAQQGLEIVLKDLQGAEKK